MELSISLPRLIVITGIFSVIDCENKGKIIHPNVFDEISSDIPIRKLTIGWMA